MKKLNKKGFTLAELLIVVAIIAVLVAVSIPVFTKQLEKSREETDIANLRSAYAVATTDALTGSYKNNNGGVDTSSEYKIVSGTSSPNAVYYARYNIRSGKLDKSDTQSVGKGTSAVGGCDPYTGPMYYTSGGSAVSDKGLYVVIKDTGGVPNDIYVGFLNSEPSTSFSSADFID